MARVRPFLRDIAVVVAARPARLLPAPVPAPPKVDGVTGLPGTAALRGVATVGRGVAPTVVAGLVPVVGVGVTETAQVGPPVGVVRPTTATALRRPGPAVRKIRTPARVRPRIGPVETRPTPLVGARPEVVRLAVAGHAAPVLASVPFRAVSPTVLPA